MRRAFQVTLLFVASLPFLLGSVTLVLGAERFVPLELVTPALDGQLRFYAVFSMLPLLLALWIVRNLDAAAPILLIVLGATALGPSSRASATRTCVGAGGGVKSPPPAREQRQQLSTAANFSQSPVAAHTSA